MFIVTGANGFIGSAMVRELNSRGQKNIICVDIVDRQERPDPLKKAEYSEFFTTSQFFNWSKNLTSNDKIQALFHMGAISSTTETDWDKLRINNIELSKDLFIFCKTLKCPFIYASSGAVYGDGKYGFSDLTDTNKFSPLNLYGKSKKEFDVWARQQSTTDNLWAGLRFFNVYGPNEYHKNEMASVAYKAFLQIKSSGRLKLFKSHNHNYADGEQVRDFIYVKDITRWMWEIYENRQLKNGIYNLGYGRSRSWMDLAKSVFTSMKTPLSIDWVEIPASLRGQYQYFTEADMTNSFAAGLSAPQYSLENGLRDYFQKYLLTDDPYV